MTSPVRIGILGAGRIGQVHAANVATGPGTRLVAIADPILDGARATAERHRARWATEAHEVITADDVDAVIIATPTPTHIDLIAAALEARVPVLCEKPIDLDIRRVDELAPAVASSAVPVALGFNRRFDPDFSAARERMLGGEIGSLEQAVITSRDPAPPPTGYIAASGGIFRDMTIHDLDMARHLIGRIAAVSATGSHSFSDEIRQAGDFDAAVVTLRGESGRSATIINSRHSAFGYDQRLELFGSAGMLQVANAGTSLVSFSGADRVEARPPYQDFFLERYASAYRAELAEFVRLVRGEPSNSPRFEDGRAALLLADAAQLSAETGRVVDVDVP